MIVIVGDRPGGHREVEAHRRQVGDELRVRELRDQGRRHQDERPEQRAVIGGLTRQLGYTTEVVVACSHTMVHAVRNVFNAAPLELYGGGGTDISVGLRWFAEQSAPVDLLVIVSDCHTPWPQEAPSFPVITIRVGDGIPPPWGEQGLNKVITIEDPL